MSDPTVNKILNVLAGEIDIPDSNYDIAERRYKALSDWFANPSSQCSSFDPHLYVQGSFRLGTVIRPLNADGEYDLDMSCRLRAGISKALHTQKQLKELVGADIETYRVAQGFKQAREEKTRCWRLKYSDNLNFHLDAVPSIPEDSGRRTLIREAMMKFGSPAGIADAAATLACAITDNTRLNYSSPTNDWPVSNTEGYALWFESRVEQSRLLMEKWASEARAARIDKLPINKRKSPLQKCIQLLKRHRDVMFKNDSDGKPISVIITTLAAMAYGGETELDDALNGLLQRMGAFVRPGIPRVPNPVNPAEDFADKWAKPEHAHHRLEQNLHLWLGQAKQDVLALQSVHTAEAISKQARSIFALELSEEVMKGIPGLTTGVGNVAPRTHVISNSPPKPWSNR